MSKSIRLFLVDDSPGGLLTAEIMNWTGHLITAPRSDLAALLKRPEANRTGVYFLLGDDPDSIGGIRTYIGEGDDISTRLKVHALPSAKGGKDFWDRVVILTSKDANLTKAHVRYLESRFITLGKRAQRASFTNGTEPPISALPEADVSDMEHFIEQSRIILPVLGINIFRGTAPATPPSPLNSDNGPISKISPTFELRLPNREEFAVAKEVDGEFTVLAGSQCRLKATGGAYNYQQLRQKLEDDGTLSLSANGETRGFSHNQVFASPSAASAVIFGRASNGRIEWRLQGSKETYADWQAKSIIAKTDHIEGDQE